MTELERSILRSLYGLQDATYDHRLRIVRLATRQHDHRDMHKAIIRLIARGHISTSLQVRGHGLQSVNNAIRQSFRD